MAIAFSVLGSGSAGNCTLVTLESAAAARHLLIDAGLSPKMTTKRLAPLGVAVEQVSDVLLTHLDHDHLHAGWLEETPSFTWRVHRRHLGPATLAGIPLRRLEVFDRPFTLGGAAIAGHLMPHDEHGSCAFVIEHAGARLGYLTDLGRMPRQALRAFDGLDALAIESNYDRALEFASDRPAPLIRRITGGLGHLSNEQCLETVLAIARRGRLRHVALLHLSRHCNDPRIVRRLYARDAPHLLDRLTIASQRAATPLLRIGRAEAPIPAGRQLDLLESLQQSMSRCSASCLAT
jgi:phosphoribosyl 1,2-cyclic phosphodiesterase